jgi:hypothetical protein
MGCATLHPSYARCDVWRYKKIIAGDLSLVIPAKAGIFFLAALNEKIPAFAGMTGKRRVKACDVWYYFYEQFHLVSNTLLGPSQVAYFAALTSPVLPCD